MNSIRLVMLSGTRTQQEKTAGDAWPGRLYGVRNTEGSSVSLRVEDGVLRGGKILCSGGGLVERALVTARDRAPGSGVGAVLLSGLSRRVSEPQRAG